MLHMIFRKGEELVIIQRILIGFQAIMKHITILIHSENIIFSVHFFYLSGESTHDISEA